MYILDDEHNPVKATIEEYSKWIKDSVVKRVSETTVGDYWVSTVFLMIDHNWGEIGPPILFESMVLDVKKNQWLDEQVRYCTWDEAVLGHAVMVERVKSGELHS